MNIELIKSYILAFLVITSLVLTFALWTYQPNYDALQSNQAQYVNEEEVDLGGQQRTDYDVIEPVEIVFQREDTHYGFTNPRDKRSFFLKMQEWVLEDYRTTVAEGPLNESRQIEIIFPESLPIEIFTRLFTVLDDDQLPNWSFERFYINLDTEDSKIYIQVLSLDGQQLASFTVNNQEHYQFVASYLNDDRNLDEFIQYHFSQYPIYIPAEQVTMYRRTLSISNIQPSLLVNALFINPSVVRSNAHESYYTDGQRGMRIEGRMMEFINPIHSRESVTDDLLLLDRSLNNINEHHGWTEDYRLVDINRSENKIIYQMHYDHYPIFSHAGLSYMEQIWRDHELHLYRRPLFTINNLLTSEQVTMPSGKDILYYLENNDNYNPEYITNIKLGYQIIFLDRISHSIELNPEWHIQYHGNWHVIKLEELF